MTKYRVMVKTSEGLDILGDAETHGPSQAMKILAEQKLDAETLAEGVTLVAVPVSNWSELPVQIRQRTPVLVIGGDPPPMVAVEEAAPAPVNPEEETTEEEAPTDAS